MVRGGRPGAHPRSERFDSIDDGEGPDGGKPVEIVLATGNSAYRTGPFDVAPEPFNESPGVGGGGRSGYALACFACSDQCRTMPIG
jgi:hypothetical protein